MSDWEFVCDRLYVRSCTSLWISVGVFVWQLCIYMWVRWGVCSCVCVCVVERHSAGLHFSDKPWWVSTEWGQDEVWHPARGFLVCVCGGGDPGTHLKPSTHHPLHPLPTSHLHPHTLHFWVEKWELLHGGCLCLAAHHHRCPSPALTARGYRIKSVIRYASRPSLASHHWNWTPCLLQIARV